jgi:predicted secreted protein
MAITSFIVIWVCSWWVIFFMTLPFGVELDTSGPEISGPGAPKETGLKKKIIITTLISVVVTGIIYALITANVVDFYGMAETMSEQDYKVQ